MYCSSFSALEKSVEDEIRTFGREIARRGIGLVYGGSSRGLMGALKVRDEIEKTKGFMGTGGLVTMSATDHMGLDLTAFRMLEVRNGNWALVK